METETKTEGGVGPMIYSQKAAHTVLNPVLALVCPRFKVSVGLWAENRKM